VDAVAPAAALGDHRGGGEDLVGARQPWPLGLATIPACEEEGSKHICTRLGPPWLAALRGSQVSENGWHRLLKNPLI